MDLHYKLLRTLCTNQDIIKKYNIYDNRFVTAEQIFPLGFNVIIINPVTQYINKSDIHNSENYNYFAVFVNNDIYIVNREKVINSIYDKEIEYTLTDFVYLSEDYLLKNNTKVLKI